MKRLTLLFATLLALAMLLSAGCSSRVSGSTTDSSSDIGDLHDRIAEINDLHDGEAGAEDDAEDP